MAARLIALTLIFCRAVSGTPQTLRFASATVKLLPLRAQSVRESL